ncbi:hypothetical protein HAV15_001688 [Penicillium sp. str. |nr:hypothetical protein HAV15_001688 [Penicillium sp. str. \
MAAADESTTKYGTSNAWGVSQRIGGSCGSVFARTLVQNLSSASNPLFDPRERSQSLHSPITQPLLHAEEPDKSQTQTYNAFCHSSWEAYFKRRWENLASHPYTGPADIRDLQNTHPDNPTFRKADPASTGGVEEIVHQMTDNIAHGRIKAMGRTLHQTCPGDWDRRRMVGLGGTLRAYSQSDEFK